MKSRIVLALAACLMAVFAMTSCNKDEAAASQSASAAQASALATKDASIEVIIIVNGDTTQFKGTITPQADGTFDINGTLTMPDGSRYHAEGNIDCAEKTFSGSVTDSDGNGVTVTDELIDVLVKVVAYEKGILDLADQYR